MTTLLALIVISAKGQSQSVPITLDEPAQRVSVLLKELSKTTGMKLEADHDAGSQVVFVSVKEVPVKELLDRIAWATLSDWVEQDDGTNLLTYSRKREAEETEKKAQEIRDRYLRAADSVYAGQPKEFTATDASLIAQWLLTGKQPSAHDAKSEDVQMSLKTPAHRLLRRILPLVDWSKLEGEANASQSTSPALDYTQLDKRVLDELPQYEREIAILAKETSKLRIDTRGRTLDAQNTDPDATDIIPSEIDVSILADHVIVWVSDGLHTLDDAFLDLSGAMEPEPPSLVATKIPSTFSAPYRSESKQVLSLTTTLAYKQDKEARDMVLHPDKYDPLSFAASDCCEGLANLFKTNFVASLPDNAHWLWVPETVMPGFTIWQTMRLVNALDAQVDEGWIAMRPKYLRKVRVERADRQAMGETLRAVVRDGWVTLDDLIDPQFAYELKLPGMEVATGLQLLMPPWRSEPDFNVLPFLRSLSPFELNKLSAAGITYGELSKAAKDAMKGVIFTEVLFSTEHRVSVMTDGPAPTDVLTLAVTRTEYPPVLEARQDEPGSGWLWNFGYAKVPTTDRGFVKRQQASVVLTLKTSIGDAKTTVRIIEGPFGLKPVSFDDLSDAQRAEIQSAIEKMKKKRGGG